MTATALVALIGASFDRALGFMWPWVGGVAFFVGFAGVCWALWASRLRVQADETGLRAGHAFLPKEFIGRVHSSTGVEAKELRTTRSDARAFVLARSWLKGAVVVEVRDERDPHPYWYVSCKRPDILEQALKGGN
jgi:hypothetical protein